MLPACAPPLTEAKYAWRQYLLKPTAQQTDFNTSQRTQARGEALCCFAGCTFGQRTTVLNWLAKMLTSPLCLTHTCSCLSYSIYSNSKLIPEATFRNCTFIPIFRRCLRDIHAVNGAPLTFKHLKTKIDVCENTRLFCWKSNLKEKWDFIFVQNHPVLHFRTFSCTTYLLAGHSPCERVTLMKHSLLFASAH